MVLLKIPSKLRIGKSCLCFSVTLLPWLSFSQQKSTFVEGIELVQHSILPWKIGDIVHHYHKYCLGEFLFSIVKQEISGPFILPMFCHVHQLLTVYDTRNSVFRRRVRPKWSYTQASELDLLSFADNKKRYVRMKNMQLTNISHWSYDLKKENQ